MSEPVIWAVSMVRNEQDVIAPVVLHLLAEGVDHVLVVDHLSTDGTRRRLERLAERHPVTVVHDDEPAFLQSDRLTALARRAAAAGATWILPFDADELWVSTRGTLRDHVIQHPDADLVVADFYTHHPSLVSPLFPGRPRLFATMPWRDAAPSSQKVLLRWRDDMVIVLGNHDVGARGPLRRVHDGSLRVHHYQYRNPRQMLRKVRLGARALELAHVSPHLGSHWHFHAKRRRHRVVLSWLKMTVRRRNLVRDPQRPSVRPSRRVA
jgi:CTP:molybdopterin cytidylyltransferase MocA